MKEALRRIVRDLRAALAAEAASPAAKAVLLPPAAPRRPPAALVLDRIAADVRACVRCGLCRSRRHAVPGEGPAETPLVLVGEAPGEDEDRLGRPFVGRAGELLTKMLAAIGVAREEVFIANVLKCRPPGNRDPAPDEVAQCRRYLEAQLEALRPLVVVTLGRVPTQSLLGTTQGILSLRGVPRTWRHAGGTCVLFPTLHPAYLLRNPAAKRDAWEDLKQVHALLREKTGSWPPPLAAPRAAPSPPPRG